MPAETGVVDVVVDATPLLGHRTGIGVAVDGYLRSLAGRREVRLAAYGLTGRGWRRLAAQLPPDVRSVARPVPAGALVRAWARADLPPGEWVTGRARVVHGTNFVVPPARRAARIVSVWDLTAVRHPELCTATSRLYPTLVARAVERGAWVHTAAESVALEIREHFRVDPARVRVVPPPVAAPPVPHRSDHDEPPAGPPYILALGRTEPRKELPTLVRAFDRLAGRFPDVQLRIAGPPGWAEDEVMAAVAASPHRDRIRRDGWVDDAAGLIAGAEVFAYPSLYEGFGLPPLEAMALGVPVVATAAGALPEVVGPAAELVGPGDAEGLAAALEQVLADPDRRAALVRAGRERAAGFSAERAAAGLVDLYRDAADG
jgi:glycosyltransferase involved in cell wall biosynthesis